MLNTSCFPINFIALGPNQKHCIRSIGEINFENKPLQIQIPRHLLDYYKRTNSFFI